MLREIGSTTIAFSACGIDDAPRDIHLAMSSISSSPDGIIPTVTR